MLNNPFIFRAYQSKELFCDRENELRQLVTNCLSGADTTLVAPRRIGKTGLIYRFIDEIHTAHLPLIPIYIDIFATRSLDDFVKVLSETILATFPEHTSIGRQFMQFIRSLRPVLSFDPLTSAPQLQLTSQTQQEKEQTLERLLSFLNAQSTRVMLAIDEFQQIRSYPEQNTEALLRTFVQRLNNITFLFCGSKRHMMLDIFTGERNPFYRSTEFLTLGKIDADIYADFIKRMFNQSSIAITSEAIDYILSWTKRLTYFTQRLCHYAYNLGSDAIGIDEAKQAALQILKADTVVFNQYQQLLTAGQWNFLIALAKEDQVCQPTSRQFTEKYRLGNSSSVSRTLTSLIDKDLINDELIDGKQTYSLSDVFLSRYLAQQY